MIYTLFISRAAPKLFNMHSLKHHFTPRKDFRIRNSPCFSAVSPRTYTHDCGRHDPSALQEKWLTLKSSQCPWGATPATWRRNKPMPRNVTHTPVGIFGRMFDLFFVSPARELDRFAQVPDRPFPLLASRLSNIVLIPLRHHKVTLIVRSKQRSERRAIVCLTYRLGLGSENSCESR